MKSIVLASSAAMFFVSGAQAADAVVYTEPVPVVVDTFSWTGGYIGVNAGYAGGKFKHPYSISETEYLPFPGTITTTTDGSLNVTSSGFVGGVQAGYNWEFDNNVVFGIEADFQGTNLKGEVKLSSDDLTIKAGTKVNWYGTLRARLGYTPVERFLVYGTGGLAYGKVKSYYDIEGFGESKSKTKAGWTIGAGVEYAFTNNWALKSEYLYTDLGKTTLVNYSDDLFGATLKNKVSFHTVRVGLNYKF
ncbi:outer membrane protein [Brucellaceae bacterium C25G]